jgi:hypothetical protein
MYPKDKNNLNLVIEQFMININLAAITKYI